MYLSRTSLKIAKSYVRAFSSKSFENAMMDVKISNIKREFNNDYNKQLFIRSIGNIWRYYPKMYTSYKDNNVNTFIKDFKNENPCDKSKEILKFVINKDINNDKKSKELNVIPLIILFGSGSIMLNFAYMSSLSFMTPIMVGIAVGSFITIPHSIYVDSSQTKFRKDAITVIDNKYYNTSDMMYFAI